MFFLLIHLFLGFTSDVAAHLEFRLELLSRRAKFQVPLKIVKNIPSLLFTLA